MNGYGYVLGTRDPCLEGPSEVGVDENDWVDGEFEGEEDHYLPIPHHVSSSAEYEYGKKERDIRHVGSTRQLTKNVRSSQSSPCFLEMKVVE